MYKNVLKRKFDLVLAFVALVFMLPVFVVITILIRLDSKGPALFKQKRIGLNKNTFYLYKFRTMKADTPRNTPTHLLKNPDSHITKIGRFLRQTSLDELPQLYNIIKGDMSIVGPRPALWNQYDLMAERDKYKANSVRPGLTGWAQVNGRDELPIPVKASLDGIYVKNISLTMDIRCIIKTITAVITRAGIAEGIH